MAATKYLIIGNGVAGITAAQEIRRHDEAGQITVIGDEGEPYYYRASLSEWIAEDNTTEMTYARTPEFYEAMHIETVTGLVSEVDPEQKSVTLENGDRMPYDKLLIATGARPNVIPIDGLSDPLAYRTWDDARKIKARVTSDARVLILGGGVLGLELAGALVEIGMHNIAIVQLMDFLGPPLLDEPAGRWLEKRIRDDGLTIFLGDTVERVEGDVAHFRSGKTWTFDLFVQSVGVRPRYPEVPELEVGRAIRIDEHATTNLPDIYAAGDCTETCVRSKGEWRPTRIWLDCARQGKVAGCSMAGVDASLTEYPFLNASILYDIHYAYIGEPNADSGTVYLNETDRTYRKVRLVDGKLSGAVLMGDRRGMMPMYQAIGISVAEYGDRVVQPDFPWNDLTGRDWGYLFF
ncbi:MAG: NAD(P)/FAD-dependent oxidoreductase [Anaerolineae bacterium]